MSNNVHLDRDALMKDKSISFPVLYENAIQRIEVEYRLPAVLQEKLKAKRDFGFSKYGERSYQGTLLNAMTTPSYSDLEEELIDCINYALNIKFQQLFDPGAIGDDGVLEALKELYIKVRVLNPLNTTSATN